jgi:hypothetical protein
MKWPTARIEEALAAAGAVFVRRTKHLVYRLPNNRSIVMAVSPSDSQRVEKNILADIKRMKRL